MKRIFTIIPLCALLMGGCAEQLQSKTPPVSMIMETDIGNDVDDALAMDIIYKYLDKKEIKLLAVDINKDGKAPADYVDILNNWYGYPNIPIGVINGGVDCENDATNYAKVVVNMSKADGTPLFARSATDKNRMESVSLLRKVLSKQKDASVTIVSVGFSTNLVRLLATKPDKYSKLDGKSLVAKKVKLLVAMAGCFDKPGFHEYNVVKDIPAAKVIFEQWPTPLVTSPFEVGIKILYPATSIENDFKWASPAHPVVEAYKAYKKMPYDRPTWDPTALLYALGEAEMFTVSPVGRISVTDEGETVFTADSNGNRRYLSVTPEQAANIESFFVKTISSKPIKYSK